MDGIEKKPQEIQGLEKVLKMENPIQYIQSMYWMIIIMIMLEQKN